MSATACKAGDLGSIPGLGRSPGEGKGYPLQYSGLENSMDCMFPWGHKESDMTEGLSLTCGHCTRGWDSETETGKEKVPGQGTPKRCS